MDLSKSACCVCRNFYPISEMSIAATHSLAHVCDYCSIEHQLIDCTCCGKKASPKHTEKVNDSKNTCRVCVEFYRKHGYLPKPKESQSSPKDLPCGICREHKDKYTTLKQALIDHLPNHEVSERGIDHNKVCYDCYGTQIYFDKDKFRYEFGVDHGEAKMCGCCGEYRRRQKFQSIKLNKADVYTTYSNTVPLTEMCVSCYNETMLHCDFCDHDFEKEKKAHRSDDKCQCLDCWSKEFKSGQPLAVHAREQIAVTVKEPAVSESQEAFIALMDKQRAEQLVLEIASQNNHPATEPTKEQTTMVQGMNMDRIMGGSLGPDTSGKFKASMMGIAIKNNEGVYCIYDGNQMVDVMDFIMPGFGDVFKLPTTNVEIGDLILHQGEAHYVRDVREDKAIEVLNPLNSKLEVLMPTKNLLGFKFFIKIISMGDMFGFGKVDTDSDNPFGNMGQMMAMSMMFGGMGGDGKSNPMTNMFGGGGSDSTNPFGGMMQMMMMTKLMGGDSGSNPFGDLFAGFGGSKKEQKPTTKKLTAAQKAKLKAEEEAGSQA